MYSRSLYSFSSVKFFLANRAFIIPLLFFKIKYVFLLHYSINIVKTTQKRQRIEKIFCTLSPAVKRTFTICLMLCAFEAGMLICGKADIRNPLRYLLMNAVASLICVQNNIPLTCPQIRLWNIRLAQMRTVIASVSPLQSHKTGPCLPR